MLTSDHRQVAAVFRIALQCSCCQHVEVIAWADQLIAEISNPDYQLIELSTSASWHIADLLSKLREISTGSNHYSALRTVLGRMYELASENRKKLANFAQGFYQIAQENQYQFPEDLCFCNHIEDEYHLASLGTYGDLTDVEQDFLDCLKPYWRQKSSTNTWYVEAALPNK